jgi:hypothetical protein
MNMGELINLPLFKTTFSTWIASTKGTEWLIDIQLENMEMDNISSTVDSNYTEYNKLPIIWANEEERMHK